MIFALAAIAVLTGVFATVVVFLCRSLVVLIFVRPSNRIPRSLVSLTPDGLPLWLSIGVPVSVTLAIFLGLMILNRWQRGLLVQRFEAGTRDPPADVRRQVTMLSKSANMPPPSIAVVDSEIPTAFTTGLRPSTAQITVTSTLLETLSKSELSAVLAHELSHIKNRDITVMTVVMTPIVVTAGLWTVMTTDTSHQPGQTYRQKTQRSVHGFDGVVSGVFGLITGVFWLLACLSVASFARYREFAADRGAAVITGEPDTVATALETISGRSPPAVDMRLVEVSPLAVLPITDTDAWTVGWETPSDWLPEPVRDVVSMSARTHPETKTRIRRLRELESTSRGTES
ncbi:M48 family metalloprotease [Haloterrigena salifodinae]|uniref:M48 family metalloprotease n=1 Tax=Haloterrigena salifodinae TaxID=2675099 RepID=UPI0013DEA895|nr:M48 family metalloprotease [Haloterrigena salifodinae]